MSPRAEPIRETSTRSATIIPLYPSGVPSSGSDGGSVLDFFPLDPADQLQQSVKAVIEALVATEYFRRTLKRAERMDDPFDPIYISALQPDPISAGDIAQLARFRDIEDLSDSITFDDGWDD